MAKKAYIGVDGKARKIKKGYVGVENFVPRALPSGYTQVEYIQSSGTQYIDTGFKPSWNSRVVVDVSDIPSGNGMIFGCRNASSATAAQQFNIYRNSDGMRSDYFGTNATLSISNTTSRTVIDKNKNVVTMYGKTVTNTAVSSGTVGYNLFLFAVNNVGSANSYASCKLRSCQIYDNGTLVRDYVPCMNASGAVGLYDIVNSKFYGNAGSGTFAAGATHSSFAKKIKKAYIGIGGVARPCWSGGELAYYGTITALSNAKTTLAGASVGDYAVFAGGYNNGSVYGTVDAYNKSLVKSTPTALSEKKTQLAAVSTGNHALFGGGMNASTNGKVVNAYNASLSRSIIATLDTARYDLAATTVGGYALFGGGTMGGSSSNVVDVYNADLTKGTSLTLNAYSSQLAATTVGGYALFGGGYGATKSYGSSTKLAIVTAFNKSLTKSTPTAFDVARYALAATTVGNYAIFAGGNVTSSNVDIYDTSLTKTTLTMVDHSVQYLAATTVGSYALFAGGWYNNGLKTVHVYDESLTKTQGANLNVGRQGLTAATVGNYALFAGGEANGWFNTVDAYLVA